MVAMAQLSSLPRECAVYRGLGRQPAALYDTRRLCLGHGRSGRQDVRASAARLRPPGLDRA